MSFKSKNVVMLPTNQNKASIYQIGNSSFIDHSQCDDRYNGRNLYIISHDEIKDGDWYINFQKKNKPYLNRSGTTKFDGLYTDCYKIIATTDNELRLNTAIRNSNENSEKYGHLDYILPQPSKEFISRFIKEYNKGNIITDVLVEYEEYNIPGNNSENEYKLKVNSKDNTITIRKKEINEYDILQILKEELHKYDVRKYICINGSLEDNDTYSQIERDIVNRIVKLFNK